eukprot:m.23540 g.23540  ORF g.23540 m.23540 type:complete len:728 (+) comp14243_c0_seq1:794-2977(+)
MRRLRARGVRPTLTRTLFLASLSMGLVITSSQIENERSKPQADALDDVLLRLTQVRSVDELSREALNAAATLALLENKGFDKVRLSNAHAELVEAHDYILGETDGTEEQLEHHLREATRLSSTQPDVYIERSCRLAIFLEQRGASMWEMLAILEPALSSDVETHHVEALEVYIRVLMHWDVRRMDEAATVIKRMIDFPMQLQGPIQKLDKYTQLIMVYEHLGRSQDILNVTATVIAKFDSYFDYVESEGPAFDSFGQIYYHLIRHNIYNNIPVPPALLQHALAKFPTNMLLVDVIATAFARQNDLVSAVKVFVDASKTESKRSVDQQRLFGTSLAWIVAKAQQADSDRDSDTPYVGVGVARNDKDRDEKHDDDGGWRFTNSMPWAQAPRCNIDRRSNLSVDEFMSEYGERNLPVIITDALHDWPANEKWKKSDFNKEHGDIEITATLSSKVSFSNQGRSLPHNVTSQTTISRYIASMLSSPYEHHTDTDRVGDDGNDEDDIEREGGGDDDSNTRDGDGDVTESEKGITGDDNSNNVDDNSNNVDDKGERGSGVGATDVKRNVDLFYIMNSSVAQRSSIKAAYRHPVYFEDKSMFDLSEKLREDFALFFLGGAGTGVGLHEHSAAWNALVYGRKRWVLYPPHSVYGPTDLPASEWLDLYHDRFEAAAFQCHQEAGEILFVPARFMHATINLETSIGLATEVGENPTLFETSLTRANKLLKNSGARQEL